MRTERYLQEHAMIHNGESYTVSVVDADMADTEIILVAFKTPNVNKIVNLTVDWGAKVGGHLDIIEGPTWNNQTGTVQTVINRDRNSANVTTILDDQSAAAFEANGKVNLNPTGLAGGTIIEATYAFTPTRESVQHRGRMEFELLKDTLYAIRFTADGAANAGIVKLNWYELAD